MSRRNRLAVIVGSLAGLWLAAAILQARERDYPVDPVPERMLYLRSGKAADRLMLTFDALAADVYWIRSIQSYGRDLKNQARADRFSQVQPLLDLTTTLDPHFQIAYRFGAIFLALEQPNGPGRPDQAIALLEKGLKVEPNNHYLARDVGDVYSWHTKNFASAADWYDRAAKMPGAPPWLHELSALARAEGGNRKGARQTLTALLESPETYIRQSAERMLKQLDALDQVDMVQKVVNDFVAEKGHLPSGWDELGRGTPLDPTRVPFAYDPATGRVSLSPQSTLMPLPVGLQPK